MKLNAFTKATPNAWLPKGFLIDGSLKRQIAKTMKLTTLLLIVALMQVSAKGFSQKINLNATNVPLEKVLHNIESQTGYVFFFDSKLVKQNVSVKVSDASITDALNACLKGSALTFQIADKTIFIRKKKEVVPTPSFTPVPVKVSGRVTDSLNKPLPGATVMNKNTQKAVLTNDNGEFALDANSGDQIAVSFIGYKVYTFSVTESMAVQIVVLHEGVSRLNEVVVSTGYQNIPKERATGSFAQLNNELLNRRTGSDIVSRLEGVVPGLLFNRNTSGSSRGNNDISIRGTNTLFSNSQPLIVLDGFPFDGDISNINPNDIENITILKDAAAASIWGVRSGNGVIVLNSKKGKRNGEMSVELNANVTASSKPDLFYDPAFLNSSDYINIEQRLFKTGFYDAQISDPLQITSPVVNVLAAQRAGTLSADQADAQINQLRNRDTRSELDKYFYRRALLQQYSLNFRGGGDKSDYYFSAGEDHNSTSLVGNQNNRITLNGSYNFYPIKNLQLSAAVNYFQTNTSSNSTAGNIRPGGRYFTAFPYDHFADAAGNALPIVKGLNYEFARDAQQQGYMDWLYRPLDELHNADNQLRTTENRINAGAQYRLIKGLDLSLKYQYENQATIGNNYFSTSTYYTRNLINQFAQPATGGGFTYPVPNAGILQQNNGNLTSQRARAQVSFDQTIAQSHRLNVIAGAEISSAITENNSGTVYGYNKETRTSFAQIDYLNYYQQNPNGSNVRIPNNLGFEKFTDHYLSYFGNAAYTYLDRYTISISGRIDRSNLFGVETNHKSVPLYSTGLAWDLSKAHFYDLNWLPYLKVRATYGYNANVNKTASAVTTLAQQSNSYYSGVPYNIINSPGNPELRWEKVRVTNFGLDFGLKNNVISGSIEYYLKKGIDLFGSSPLPPSTGFVSFYGNTANTSGHGFDLVINSRNIFKDDFKWTTGLLLSHVIDQVTVYDSPSSAIVYLSSGSGNGGTITPLAGQSIYGIYSFRSGPLMHDTGDPQGYLAGSLSTDYNKIISGTSVTDLYYNGPARPTTFGSLRNTFNYKNWTLSANLIFKLNYYFRRTSTALSYDQIAYGGVNRDYAERWQNPGDELKTTVPSILMPPANSDRQTFYQYSQALVDKGDHIRLQDIRLSYSFKPFGGQNPVFNRLEVFSYLNNVGILWRANKHHLDPDLYSGAYPLPRTLSVGFNSRF